VHFLHIMNLNLQPKKKIFFQPM